MTLGKGKVVGQATNNGTLQSQRSGKLVSRAKLLVGQKVVGRQKVVGQATNNGTNKF